MTQEKVPPRQGARRITVPTEISTWADVVRYLRATRNWSQRRTAQEFGVNELAVRNWEKHGSLPNCGLIARHMASLVPHVSLVEVEALSRGAYLDPPKKISQKKGREKSSKKS